MPIYTGNWHDGDGVPFTPEAYAEPNRTQGQSVMRRRRVRHPHPTPQETAATFRRAAWLWQTELDQTERDEWIQRAADWNWHCRTSGDKHLPPFALFVRSTMTQLLYDVPQDFHIHLIDEPPWCTLTTALYNFATEQIQLVFDNPVPTIDYEYSSLTVYQLRPSQTWYFPSPLTTHQLGHVSPWPAAAPGVWSGELHWPASPDVDLYIYARWHQDYRFAGAKIIVSPLDHGELTGTLDPDISGRFHEDGIYGGEMSYKHNTLDWWIWHLEFPSFYLITSVKGATTYPEWYKYPNTDPEGLYLPVVGTGDATFTLD